MKNIQLYFFILLCISLVTCKKDKLEPPDYGSLITITTRAVINIEYRGAEVSGTLDTYSQEVSDYGHCWSTEQKPDLTDNNTKFGKVTGNKLFTSKMENLEPGTKYYVRAYFIIDDTIVYANQKAFSTIPLGSPIVQTLSVTDISVISAISGGNITDDGGLYITTRGVCWNTTGSPTISDSKTSDGSEIGSFTSKLSGLQINTTYYVKAYVTTSASSIYGNEQVFSTKDGLPEITTMTLSNITALTAESGGEITDDGSFSISSRGVCWNTTGYPTIYDSKTSDGTGIGSFTSNLAGLFISTSYYLRAYATNSIGTSYGSEQIFTTKDGIPQLSTSSVTDIAATTATSGGNITYDGGIDITERGVCWNTSGSPATTDSKTSDGTGAGSFASNITGLTAETDYYLRAYATNSFGTEYGNEVFFTNKTSGSYTDNRDGNTYDWVRIGDQIWMAKNLAYLPNVSPPSSESETDSYYYVYDYEGSSVGTAKATSNYQTYGVLYNWPAAIESCPSGWHLPGDEEWKEMEIYLGMSQSEADDINHRGTDEGGKLKETGTTHWVSPNEGATNESGFTALPGGYRNYGGTFSFVGVYGYWWSSSTEHSSVYAWLRDMNYNHSDVRRYRSSKESGFSVRCVRDN